jgi:hypothetical protein
MPEENFGLRPGNLHKLTSKAEVMKVLNDAFSYCDSSYSGLTDASGAEVIDISQENGRQTRNLRMGLFDPELRPQQ